MWSNTACTIRSAVSSVNLTRIRYRCLESWICSTSQRVVSIGPCAGSSMAVTNSGYLSPLHMMLKYHSCHFVFSPRKTGGFPSRHLLESLDLCRQLPDSALVFNSGFSEPSTDYGLHTSVGLFIFRHPYSAVSHVRQGATRATVFIGDLEPRTDES